MPYYEPDMMPATPDDFRECQIVETRDESVVGIEEWRPGIPQHQERFGSDAHRQERNIPSIRLRCAHSPVPRCCWSWPGTYLVYHLSSKEEAPSRDFTELEFAGADDQHTGSCYSLSTVLDHQSLFQRRGANLVVAARRRVDAGARRVSCRAMAGRLQIFQKFTFEKDGDQVRLASVEASEKLPTDLKTNIDALLESPRDTAVHAGRSLLRSPAPRAICSFRDADGKIVARFAAMPASRIVVCTLSLFGFCAIAQAQQVIPLWDKARPALKRGASNPSSTRTGGTRTSTILRSPCSCLPRARPMARRSSLRQAVDIASWCSIPKASSPRSISRAWASPRSR